jgi:hypothetical protein
MTHSLSALTEERTGAEMAAKKIRLESFTFQQLGKGWEVFHRGRSLGTIEGTTEGNGRHAFRLGFDRRQEPRTYRGMLRAATALQAIDSLKRQARSERWCLAGRVDPAGLGGEGGPG